jgi:hypothetical protein
MSATGAWSVPAEAASSAADEVRKEQSHADWAYERLDNMLESALNRENAGIHAAAAYALWKMQEERAERIRLALADRNGLIIGRLDMVDDDEIFYVGRHSVEGDDGRPAVVSWQTEMASRFYQASRRFPAGIGRRRTIRMAERAVTGISDETLVPGFMSPTFLPAVQPPPVTVERRVPRAILAPVELLPALIEPAPAEAAPSEPDLVSPPAANVPTALDDGLLGEPEEREVRAGDLLLEDLARQRTGALEDIVATIQADQDRLVRAPYDVPLIVQGGPGTGKTIVGLHRAAWVLYQQRARLIDQSVLVVGPNPKFIEYISSVLPSLGETDVRQLAIDELALDNLSTADRARIRVDTVERRDVARIKGDLRMASVIRGAVWSGVAPRRLSFGYGRLVLRLDEDLVDTLIGKLWQQRVSYNAARTGLADGLAQAFLDEYVRRRGRRAPAGGTRELRQVMSAARKYLTSSGELAGIYPAVEPRDLLLRLYADPKLLDGVGTVLSPGERTMLHRAPTRGRTPVAWTAADLPLLDEAATCIRGETNVAGHVVVDEAQDLSPMQWRLLSRRTSQSSMTILGDLAQATSPWPASSWSKVIQQAGLSRDAEIAELSLGYRVPAQVMDFAAPLLATAAPGVTAPQSFRVTVDPLVRRTSPGRLPGVTADLVRSRLAVGAIAVIVPPELNDNIMQALGGTSDCVAVLAPEASKGMEFDVVVVVEPAAIARKTLSGLRLLYVTLTRATKELIVVHSKPLPGGIGGSHRPLPPSTHPNPRNDDPWDNDAVHWLLDQPGGERWTRGVLMECLRRQANQVERNPRRVEEAARFAKRHGVVLERTERGSRSIVRFYRTDDTAPGYPGSEAARRAS